MCFGGKFTASQTAPVICCAGPPVSPPCLVEGSDSPPTIDHRPSIQHTTPGSSSSITIVHHSTPQRRSSSRSRGIDDHVPRLGSRSRSDPQVYMRISEERGITGLTTTPVGDDETRIPNRPRPHELFQLLGSFGHARDISLVVPPLSEEVALAHTDSLRESG